MKKLIDSFGYAIQGICYAAKAERNMQIHIVAAVVAILSGWYWHFSATEWLFIIVVIGQVMSAELHNTALERVANVAAQNRFNEEIRIAKNASAGSVLTVAMEAFVVGIIILNRHL